MATGRRGIFLLLLLSLVIRLGWAVAQPNGPAAIDRLPDQREYLSLGQNLLHHGSLSFVDPRFHQTVYAYRTPGYPLFIALCGGSPLIVRLIQALVDTSTILAVYLLARRLSDKPFVPLFAAAAVAVNPFLIYFSGLILSETLFTGLLAWGVLLLIRRQIWPAAILLAAGVWVRPSALALAPCLAIAASWVNSDPASPYPLLLGRALRGVVIVSGVLILSLLPWAIRNHRVLGQWVWVTTNGGVTLYDGFNPQATGASDQRFVRDMPELQSMNEVQRSRYLQQRARQWAVDHPARLPELTLAKSARTWSPVPLSREFGRPAYRLLSAAYAIPFDLLVLIGLFSPALSRRGKWLLITPALYFTLVHALSVGSLRYRVPIEPELAVIAAAGIGALFTRTEQF
jgi:hypothetical protein